jgi:integrase
MFGKSSIELKDRGGRGEGRLALVVRPFASQVVAEWYAVYYRGGKRLMTKIGTYPLLGLADARRSFREVYAPLIASGQVVAGPRAKTTHNSATVLDLFQAYVEHLERTARPRSAKQARTVLLGGKKGGGAAKAIGEWVSAADVKPQHIIPHLAGVHKRGSVVMARKVRTYISGAFAFGIRSCNSYTSTSGSSNWGITANPAAAIPADRDAHRAGERHLSVTEFRAFWRWLEGRDQNSLAAPLLRLMMATGQRMEEFLYLTNVQYDRNERMLDWSRTKNDQPHAVPLTPHAIDVLNSLVPSRHGLFFPGRARADAPLSMNAIEKEVERFI